MALFRVFYTYKTASDVYNQDIEAATPRKAREALQARYPNARLQFSKVKVIRT